MRIRAVSVEHFRCIRAASVTFGPGLNVLYGPNDLGKSSLAEALRAALLLPSTSTEYKSFVPSGTDDVPKVVLTFEAAEGAGEWRVTKAFGVRGTAVLESSKDGAKWHADARGRDVDGRIRGLLSWGIPAPGGKGAPHGMGQAFLTTALLGRQGEVDAILAASLEEDKDPSGREIVTRALNVLGQDPLVQRLLARLQDKTDEVFTTGGKQRRTVGSPLMRFKQDIETREAKLRELDEAARKSEEVQRSIREHIAARDRIAEDRDAAAARVGQARHGIALAERRGAAEKAVEIAKEKLDRVLAAHRSVAEAWRSLAESEAALAGATERARAADEAVGAREADARVARERVEAARAARGEAKSAAEHASERRVSELRAELAAAQSRAEAAREARGLEERALSLRCELGDAEADLEERKRLEVRAGLLLRHAALRGELREATQTLESARAAEVIKAARKSAFEASALAVEAAEATVDAARRGVEAVRDEVTRGRAAAAAEDARRQALLTNLMQVEAAEREALALTERAQAAMRRDERLLKLDEGLTTASAHAAATEEQLGKSSLAVERAEQEHHDLAAVVVWRRLEDVSRRRKGLASPASGAELRTRASDARARESEIASSSSTLPTAERLAATVAINERRNILRASAQPDAQRVSFPVIAAIALGSGVGLALLLHAVTAIGTAAIALLALLATVVSGALCVAALRLKNGVRAARSRSTQQIDREYVERRWEEEVGPLLRAAGAADVDALARRCHEAEARRSEAAGLREEAERLESQARLAERDAESLALLRREEESLRSQLAGYDLSALAVRAAAVESAAGDTLDRMLRQAEVATNTCKRSREQILESRSRATIQMESARALLNAARAERDLHAGSLGAEPRAVLDEAGRRVHAARAQAEELRQQIASLGSPAAAGPSPMRSPQAVDEALAVAAADIKVKGAARDQAARELIEAETRHELCVGAAAARDVGALERRVAEAFEALGGDAADERDPDAELDDLDQRKQEAEDAGTRVAGLRARGEEATRSLEQALAALAAPWAGALAETEETVTRLQRELDAGGVESREQIDATARELARLEAFHGEVEGKLAVARSQAAQTAAERDAHRTVRDRAKGQLEERENFAAGVDQAGAEAELERARLGLAALPDTSPVTPADLDSAQLALDGFEKVLRRVEDDLREARGKLAVVGGALAQERLQEEREALERLRDTAVELELEYAASRLLQATLKEAEAIHAAHLGSCLATPVTERFMALTGGRYAQVSLDPALKTRAVIVGGELRSPAALSVGTRDQLATIVRLALAGQLKSVVLLDDQLVQSDPTRLEWFRQALRANVRDQQHQVLVFTCRTEDYLTRDELPAPGESQRESDGGRLLSTDLEKVIRRVDRP